MKFVVFEFDGPKLENQNMHFGTFDRPVPVKYPKMHILIFQNLKIKICILGYLTGVASQIFQNAYFDFLVLENQNMHFGIFDWRWLVKYPKMYVLICQVLFSQKSKTANFNLQFDIF